jgi:hypothetical protein
MESPIATVAASCDVEMCSQTNSVFKVVKKLSATALSQLGVQRSNASAQNVFVAMSQ